MDREIYLRAIESEFTTARLAHGSFRMARCSRHSTVDQNFRAEIVYLYESSNSRQTARGQWLEPRDGRGAGRCGGPILGCEGSLASLPITTSFEHSKCLPPSDVPSTRAHALAAGGVVVRSKLVTVPSGCPRGTRIITNSLRGPLLPRQLKRTLQVRLRSSSAGNHPLTFLRPKPRACLISTQAWRRRIYVPVSGSDLPQLDSTRGNVSIYVPLAGPGTWGRFQNRRFMRFLRPPSPIATFRRGICKGDGFGVVSRCGRFQRRWVTKERTRKKRKITCVPWRQTRTKHTGLAFGFG